MASGSNMHPRILIKCEKWRDIVTDACISFYGLKTENEFNRLLIPNFGLEVVQFGYTNSQSTDVFKIVNEELFSVFLLNYSEDIDNVIYL